MSTYTSDVVMGDVYVDDQTGFEGVATAVSFYQYACERVLLEAYDPERRTVKEIMFDAPRLRHQETSQLVTSTKTGGPRDDHLRASEGAPRR